MERPCATAEPANQRPNLAAAALASLGWPATTAYIINKDFDPMEIRCDDPTAPHVADLLAHHLQELRSVMAEYAFALDATGLSAPGVTFWTAWCDAHLAGFGALKELDAGHGEVKSMRVATAARGTGVGRAMLEFIICEARTRGYKRLSLETGTAILHAPAVALYRRAGFVPCEAFADYRASPHNQFLTITL